MSTIIWVKQNNDVCELSVALLYTLWKQDTKQLERKEKKLYCAKKKPTVCKVGFFLQKAPFL